MGNTSCCKGSEDRMAMDVVNPNATLVDKAGGDSHRSKGSARGAKKVKKAEAAADNQDINMPQTIGNVMENGNNALQASGNRLRNDSDQFNGQKVRSFSEIEKMPDFGNDATRRTEQELGSYDYSKNNKYYKMEMMTLIDDSTVISKGPHMMDNKSCYLGQWNQQGHRHGKGILTWPDGSKFEGFWQNDKAHGMGRLIHSDGSYYEGCWESDRAYGLGKFEHVSGPTYDGEWIMDLQHGVGTETWNDNTIYEGQYECGKKHGRGTFKWQNGAKYSGEFRNNIIQEHGQYIWPDGRRYDGQWHLNKMHGKGTFNWPDGRCYTGQYCENQKHGYGEITWKEGRYYKGDWMMSKQHGKGRYMTQEGVEKYGIWELGKRVKWIGHETAPAQENYQEN